MVETLSPTATMQGVPYMRTDPRGAFVTKDDYDSLAADLSETQRQLKMVAPVGRYNGRNIEEWANYGAALEAALKDAIEPWKGWNFDSRSPIGRARDLIASAAETKTEPHVHRWTSKRPDAFCEDCLAEIYPTENPPGA